MSSGSLKFCFRAEILRCKNQVVQKHFQLVPKHGNMGKNILIRLHRTLLKNNNRPQNPSKFCFFASAKVSWQCHQINESFAEFRKTFVEEKQNLLGFWGQVNQRTSVSSDLIYISNQGNHGTIWCLGFSLIENSNNLHHSYN